MKGPFWLLLLTTLSPQSALARSQPALLGLFRWGPRNTWHPVSQRQRQRWGRRTGAGILPSFATQSWFWDDDDDDKDSRTSPPPPLVEPTPTPSPTHTTPTPSPTPPSTPTSTAPDTHPPTAPFPIADGPIAQLADGESGDVVVVALTPGMWVAIGFGLISFLGALSLVYTLFHKQPEERVIFLRSLTGGEGGTPLALPRPITSPIQPPASARVGSPSPSSVEGDWRVEQIGADNPTDIGDFRVSRKLLGQGGFGQVYLGLCKRTGALVAVKKMPAPRSAKVKEALKNETDLVMALKSPHIVEHLAVHQSRDHLFIAMENMAGGALSDVVKIFPSLPEPQVAQYTRSILLGLRDLHSKNIIHRDIKPGNILLTADGDCKLADFGTAAARDGIDSLENTDALAITTKAISGETFQGTLLYSSPELLEGTLTRKCDIWALGVTVYELLTGVNPLRPTSGVVGPAQIMTKVLSWQGLPDPGSQPFSEEAEGFLRQALDPDMNQRPTAEELLQHPFVRERQTGDLPWSRDRMVMPRVTSFSNIDLEELQDPACSSPISENEWKRTSPVPSLSPPAAPFLRPPPPHPPYWAPPGPAVDTGQRGTGLARGPSPSPPSACDGPASPAEWGPPKAYGISGTGDGAGVVVAPPPALLRPAPPGGSGKRRRESLVGVAIAPTGRGADPQTQTPSELGV